MRLFETAVALILGFLIFCFVRFFKCANKKLPPGPYGLPIVGYLPFLNSKNPHYSLTKMAAKYGKIYSIQMGSVFTVVLSDVKLVRQALAQEAFSGRAPLYLTHGIMKGNGIICVQGEKWKEQRKFVVNWLRHFGMVKFGEKRLKMESDIKGAVEELVEKIKRRGDAPVDVEHWLMHSLGNVVFNLVFGKSWREEDETWKKLIGLQEEGTKLIGVAGPINFLPWLRFLPKYKKAIAYIENGISFSHDIYQKILREYQKGLSPRSAEDGSYDESGGMNFSHFLGAFDDEMAKRKNEKSHYTTTQFNFLMADLWGAGVDTTITTLRWVFLYMAHHGTYQENVQREMDNVLGEKDLALDDIPSLPYLQACISEVQRIRSVTPLGIPHGAIEDSILDGYDIPKGTMIVPLQWAIHMNEMYHEDPDTYAPSRFMTADGKYVKPEAFIPFQTGKRMCLGEEYAKMLLFLYAGTILQNFELSLEGPADFEGDVGITLTPKPHRIKFSERKK